ncbi:glycosyltransferase [Vibrio cholerae]|uniref:glycosyltransferase n=1 Tax=Vibrio cholerae TaxID=666 RepID=UPI000F0BB0DA|nr:glycosyltransferase [Vibrio cholerae]EGQ9892772.1 glycosyltransferase family 4 protein [Vibrio cholerae]EJO4004310.1 glycosyltransferase [Vibrio cholerae]RNE82476.1 glycosyltransferase family 1 protein [Vibrio cholerae]
MSELKKVLVIVSSPMTINSFLLKHIRLLSSCYDVSVVANFTDVAQLGSISDCAKLIPVRIERKISILRDTAALLKILKIIYKGKYNAVHSYTPKAGLLSITASYFCFVENRFHTFTGQVWANKVGFKKFFLKSLDRFIAKFATQIIVDSHSQLDFLVSNNVCDRLKSKVFLQGSVSGVDTERFSPCFSKKIDIRSQYNIKDSDLIILYLGRLNRDKGLYELLVAFSILRSKFNNLKLLLVGPDEEGIEEHFKKTYPSSSFFDDVIFVGYTTTPEIYMQASDIFCLPSHREGFGTSVIEAASVGLPTVASNIYGLSDAVLDFDTGILFEVGNPNKLSEALETMISSSEERNRLALNALLRARSFFKDDLISEELLKFYKFHIGL